MPIPTIAAILIAQSLSSSCGIAPHAEVHTIVNIGPTTTRSDYSVSDIVALAKSLHGGNGQTPAGFYAASFFYRMVFNVENGADGPCRSRLKIDVELNLTDRLIEIGRDIDRSSCEFQKEERHYMLKANADESLFKRYVAKVSEGLEAFAIPEIKDGHLTAAEFESSSAIKASVEAAIKSRIDEMLNPLTEDRRSAGDGVDTPQELSALAAPCSLPL